MAETHTKKEDAPVASAAKPAPTQPAPQAPRVPPEEPRTPAIVNGLICMVGERPKDRALCQPDGKHAEKLADAGWKPLHEVSAARIRDIGKLVKAELPPRAKADTLALALLRHLLAPPKPPKTPE